MFLFTNIEKHPYFDESIYNLLDERKSKCAEEDKPTRYRSKYSSVVKEEFNAIKSAIPRTMGYMHTPLRTPQDYLKKHSRAIKADLNKSVTCLCRCKGSKEIPRIPEASSIVMDNYKRNFIQENVLGVSKRPRTAPATRRIDSRKGDTFVLEESGWVPKYSHKKDYGEIPSYLVKIQRNLKHSLEEFEKFITAEDRVVQPQRLSEESKQTILEGLVKNLQELLKRYLKLPMSIDTPHRIKRKEEIERRIDALQRDIDLIRNNKDILIGRGRPVPSIY